MEKKLSSGREAYIERLKKGETVAFRESGNSMTPRIKHRQLCTYAPITTPTDIQEGDAVFCKVKGNYYTHLVKAVKQSGDSYEYLIGNNHGGINGWTTYDKVFGKVIKIEP